MITRVDDHLHARAKRRAKDLGLTLNELVVAALERELATGADPLPDARRRAEALGLAAAPARAPGEAAPDGRDRVIASARGTGRAVSEALEWARG